MAAKLLTFLLACATAVLAGAASWAPGSGSTPRPSGSRGSSRS